MHLDFTHGRQGLTLPGGGTRLRFLVSSEMSGDSKMTVLFGLVAPGLIVPLHSHTEAEIFYVQASNLEPTRSHLGRRCEARRYCRIRGAVKHAWRKQKHAASELLVFTRGYEGGFNA